MSQSEGGLDRGGSPGGDLNAAAAAALRLAEAAIAAGDTRTVSDLSVQNLFVAATRLYSAKVEGEERVFPPLPDRDSVTATEVVVAVSGMLQAADLNTFDLTMWFGRTKSP